MKKILVTGANGQLGSELKTLAPGFAGFSFRFTDYDTLDITDREAVSRFFEAECPDFVVNCAAYTAVDKAETDRENAFLLNAVAPGILAEACNRSGAVFLHISTDYVFNGKNYKPYCETDETDPQGVYGLSKRVGEQNSLADCPRTIIIRTAWLYSAFGANFVKTMLRLGAERNSLQVVYDQVGTPTYACDLAAALLQIVAQVAENPGQLTPGIFHYSGEGVCSWYDFARAIHELAGITTCQVFPVESKDYPTAAARPHFSVLNKSKIRSTYGIAVPYWKESLKVCIQKIKNIPL